MRVLALDFDGVICDSAREAFTVAVRSFAEVFPEHRLPGAAEEDAGLYARFIEVMPLGNRAEDYAVSLAAFAKRQPLPDQAAYDAFCESLDKVQLRAFHKRFYQIRSAWAGKDPEAWLTHMAPYPGITELLQRRASDVHLAIATAKDRASVRRLLMAYGIAELFPDGFVLDKEAGVKKHLHIEQLAERTGVSPADITFVDDKVNHLEDVATLGARCILAAWGYNGARERRVAEAQGFLVCELEEFERACFEKV
jgi:phosphoglycolate phosphatase-like HAD superfamily hydrolase